MILHNNLIHLFENYHYKNFQHKIQNLSTKKMIDFYVENFMNSKYKFDFDRENNKGIISFKFFNTLSNVLNLNCFFLDHYLLQNEIEEDYQFLFKKSYEKYINKIDFIIARQPIDSQKSIQALFKNNFYYVCSESIFSKNISKQEITDNDKFKNISIPKEEELSVIKEIALNYHKCNRYLRDEFFNPEIIQKLFERSIERTYKKNWLYVYKEQGEILGYITFLINEKISSFHEKASYGSLDYIVVKEKYQGKNIGFLLNQYAIRELQKKQVSFLSVKTMANNYPAIRLLHRDQFILTSQNVIMHLRK